MVKPINEEPPQLKNGSGIPITGTKPMVIPIFIVKWKNKIEATQQAKTLL